ncbi:unnamed protein product, partial [Ectocarpus sp. 12 AP-2014]
SQHIYTHFEHPHQTTAFAEESPSVAWRVYAWLSFLVASFSEHKREANITRKCFLEAMKSLQIDHGCFARINLPCLTLLCSHGMFGQGVGEWPSLLLCGDLFDGDPPPILALPISSFP